ncbi:MAG: gliding motility protein GldN, partial [Flavobacteriaceae bacterium]
MKVNKGILVLLAIVLYTTTIFSQANLLNATIPEEIGVKTEEQLAADNDKPLPYGYVDDRDILWSKMVWEYIDLNEKINLPYYYPADTSNIDTNRRSLFDTLLRGIKNEEIVDFYDDSYFTDKLTLEDIDDRLHKKELTDAGVEAKNFGEEVTEDMYDIRDLQSADIQGFRIKGLYYFDKRQGELKYRLLGVAPVSPDVNFIDSMDEPGDMAELIPLFWVWYPGIRDIMHEMKVFNSKNSAFPLSYDLILNARRFNAF